MKKLLIFSLLAAIFTFGFSTDIQAQSRGKKKKKSSKTDEYFDDSGNWTQKLWYGTGGTLGFNGGQFTSIFSIGISPMVGYKITPWLSAGPRFSITYNGIKGGSVNLDENFFEVPGTQELGPFKTNAVALSAGAFVRAKFLQSFFVQAEIENYSIKSPGRESVFSPYFYRDDATLEFIKFKENRTNAYFGGGYNSSGGGLIGYEIAALYNFLAPVDTQISPLEIRVGLTYNF